MLNRLIILIGAVFLISSFNPKRGDIIDSFNGIPVFYNGSNYKKTSGRSTTPSGYNLGLKYQCVEFVKRYYYEVFNHEMPDSYGHAKDFFDKNLPDVAFNKDRALIQYRNVRNTPPEVHDIIIYGERTENRFGHMGIVTEVTQDSIEFIQQNFGRKTRQKLGLVEFMGIYTVADYDILGWLRMPE
ncbi:MAG: CHAP domain-containing protein [Saprospiraceae bacterium]|nr:CHAP domain-containing protein [Saprospiraceae bacterium]